MNLTIPVKAVYFDQIVSGEKLEEYRKITPYWTRRIDRRSYDNVVLTRGYPKDGGIEGITRHTVKWNGYRTTAINHPHFGPEPERVYAIDVSDRFQ